MMTPAQSPLLCDKLGWSVIALKASEVTEEAGREVTGAHRHWLGEDLQVHCWWQGSVGFGCQHFLMTHTLTEHLIWFGHTKDQPAGNFV